MALHHLFCSLPFFSLACDHCQDGLIIYWWSNKTQSITRSGLINSVSSPQTTHYVWSCAYARKRGKLAELWEQRANCQVVYLGVWIPSKVGSGFHLFQSWYNKLPIKYYGQSSTMDKVLALWHSAYSIKRNAYIFTL